MRIPKNLVSRWVLLATFGTWSWCFLATIRAAAQNEGNNAVWASNITGSSAFIDASTFYRSVAGSPDICQVINGILNGASGYGTYPATGAVIDARGILKVLPNGSTGPGAGSQPCSINPFQASGGGLVSVPSTVLLPASKLALSVPWVLPSNTRIVGEGIYTNLIAGFSTGDMIDMCTTTSACTGISIEHLELTGPSVVKCDTTPPNQVNGIVNYYAQSSSFVNDVSFCGIGLTGVKITSNASNSGPYSNINFTAATAPSSPSYCSGGPGGTCPVCVDIEAQTRGIHELSCIGTVNVSGNNVTGTPTNGDAAIYVNASNNSIEDVHIEGFFDGIEVGDIATALGNILVANIQGESSGKGKVRNTVHICGTHYVSGGQFGNCLTPGTVSDVTLLGIQDNNNSGSSGGGGSTSVQDDATNTSITPPQGQGKGVTTALYGLGEAVAGGYPSASRFSTSPSATSASTASTMVPTWVAGGTTTSLAGIACNTPGFIYSNTQGGSSTSVYVCSYNTSSGGYYWQPIS